MSLMFYFLLEVGVPHRDLGAGGGVGETSSRFSTPSSFRLEGSPVVLLVSHYAFSDEKPLATVDLPRLALFK